MIDQNFLDEKIIAVPFGDPTYNVYKSIHELPFHISEEIMHFFSVYKTLEGKKTAVNTISDADKAMQKIEDYLAVFEKNKENKTTEVTRY
jgi:inorganic pyrophosphatase